MSKSRFPIFVPEKVVRSIATLVFFLAMLALVLKSPWIALILAIDFALRSLVTPRSSYLVFIAKRIVTPLFRSKNEPVPFRPKRFAALIGLALSGAAFLLGIFEISIGFYLLMGVLALFSSLEAFAGFCAGCEMFAMLMKLRIISADNCPECSNLLERKRHLAKAR